MKANRRERKAMQPASVVLHSIIYLTWTKVLVQAIRQCGWLEKVSNPIQLKPDAVDIVALVKLPTKAPWFRRCR